MSRLSTSQGGVPRHSTQVRFAELVLSFVTEQTCIRQDKAPFDVFIGTEHRMRVDESDQQFGKLVKKNEVDHAVGYVGQSDETNGKEDHQRMPGEDFYCHGQIVGLGGRRPSRCANDRAMLGNLRKPGSMSTVWNCAFKLHFTTFRCILSKTVLVPTGILCCALRCVSLFLGFMLGFLGPRNVVLDENHELWPDAPFNPMTSPRCACHGRHGVPSGPGCSARRAQDQLIPTAEPCSSHGRLLADQLRSRILLSGFAPL